MIDRLAQFFTGRPYTLVTPLTPAECRERLAAQLTPRGDILLPYGDRVFWGRVTAERFSVEGITRGGNNLLQPEATGQFIPVPGGTRIEVRVVQPRFSRITFVLGCILLAVGWVVFVGPFVVAPSVQTLTAALIIVAVTGGFTFFYLWGRDEAWSSEARLVDPFQRTLAAEQVTGS